MPDSGAATLERVISMSSFKFMSAKEEAHHFDDHFIRRSVQRGDCGEIEGRLRGVTDSVEIGSFKYMSAEVEETQFDDRFIRRFALRGYRGEIEGRFRGEIEGRFR